jgi:DNA topoisomerase-1
MSEEYNGKILFILESPGKVKTVQKYLGDSYRVESSVGHIRTLGTEKVLGVDLVGGTFAPTYNIDDKKRDVVAKLRRAAQGASTVYLASDFDREGEGIAWHIKDTLGLRDQDYRRIKFTEITERAIHAGIATPGMIDMNMVYSQQSRQILDKMIGYQVSPCLWQEYSNHKLSAGRVQSVAVRLLAEREREIETFKSANYYSAIGHFTLSEPSTRNLNVSADLQAELDQQIGQQEEAQNLIMNIASGRVLFTVDDLKVSSSKRTPGAPFITSSLQQEASNKLGMGPDECMSAAQKLYEAGLITYMRTDSHIISADALTAIGKLVIREYGEKYHNRTQYAKKVAGAQEAHEAIRPTNIEVVAAAGEKIGPREKRLYQIIWRRTVASQMVPAQIETSTIKISLDAANCMPVLNPVRFAGGAKKYTFSAKFEKVLFDGFLRVYNYGADGATADEVADTEGAATATTDGSVVPSDDGTATGKTTVTTGAAKKKQQAQLEKLFTTLAKGQRVWCLGMTATEKDTQPPNGHYTEAGLVKKLEELKIGRPSTYAMIIGRIQERSYVEKKTIAAKQRDIQVFEYQWPVTEVLATKKSVKSGGEKNKLFITGLGLMITDFLVGKFSRMMDYEFTARVEELLDGIALGTARWQDVVRGVWEYINPIILELRTSSRGQAGGGKELKLGINPLTQREVSVIKTRNGWAICEKHPDDKKKHRWSNIGTTQPEKVTLEQACALLVYPRTLGQYLDKPVELCKAKSVYLRWSDTNYSLEIYIANNPGVIQDPETITLPQAIAVIETTNREKTEGKLKAALSLPIQDLPDAVIKSGPYGFYIKYLDQYNIPVPTAYKKDPTGVTKQIAEAAIAKYLGKGKERAGGVGPSKSDRGDTVPSLIEQNLINAAAANRGAKTSTTVQDGPSSASNRGSGRGRGRGTGRGKRGARTAASVTEGSIAPIPTGSARGRGRGR